MQLQLKRVSSPGIPLTIFISFNFIEDRVRLSGEVGATVGMSLGISQYGYKFFTPPEGDHTISKINESLIPQLPHDDRRIPPLGKIIS